MSVEEVASFTIPLRESYRLVTWSRDGTTLMLGYNSHEGSDPVLGIRWLNWATKATDAVDLPRGGLQPDLASTAWAVDVDGENALAHTQVTYGNKPGEQLWVVSRSGRPAPRLLHQGSRVPFSLSSDGSHVLFPGHHGLGLHALATSATQWVRTLAGAIEAIALAPDLQHLAVAGDNRVRLGHGAEELTSWQFEGRINVLGFAERDLTLFGFTHDAIIRFRWNETPVALRIPNAAPVGFDAAGCVALFAGYPRLYELDLLTGTRRDLGEVTLRATAWDFDVKRRRLAMMDHAGEVARIRILEAAPEG
jgi:hypothetical protein